MAWRVDLWPRSVFRAPAGPRIMKDESADDPRRRELGQFLRSRRGALNPDDLGLKPHAHRREEGLSRQQIAELAGISADWYGRLEGGQETTPSRTTLLNVVNALRLTPVESTFVFDLAGLTEPRIDEDSGEAGAEVLDRLRADPSRVGIGVLDAYVTPVKWNAIADALWHFSGLDTAIERNFIVRLADPYLVSLTGTEYESSVQQLVGMFRRAHTRKPTPFSQQILEVALREAIFCRFWDDQFGCGTDVAGGRALPATSSYRGYCLDQDFESFVAARSRSDRRGGRSGRRGVRQKLRPSSRYWKGVVSAAFVRGPAATPTDQWPVVAAQLPSVETVSAHSIRRGSEAPPRFVQALMRGASSRYWQTAESSSGSRRSPPVPRA